MDSIQLARLSLEGCKMIGLLSCKKRPKSPKCPCALCTQGRATRGVLRRRNVKEMRKWIRWATEWMSNEGTELEMARAYIDDLTNKSSEKSA